jgi:N-acetylmuramoyl-L-alanine amidase
VIILHHTALPYTTTSAEAVRRWHVEKRGFSDIGYHYLVRMHRGLPIVEAGRPVSERGAHCYGHQTGIGVCVAGDWSTMDPRQYKQLWDRVIAHLAGLCRGHSIPVVDILGHHEADPPASRRARGCPPTECPGTRIDMDAIRATVTRYLGSYSPRQH